MHRNPGAELEVELSTLIGPDGKEIETIAIVPQQQAVSVQAGSLLEIIARVASSPNVNIEAMRQLLEMQRQVVADQRKVAFTDALARLHAVLPPMDKFGQAKNSKYAKLEDIDAVIRPLMAVEGFSFSFDEESHSERAVTFIATLSHKEGHSEIKRLTVPIDVASKNSQGASIRPAIQDAGSTVTYARRYLIKMHLNIIEKGEDTNGEKREKISAEEAKDLSIGIADHNLDLPRFLLFMRVGAVEEILKSDLRKAWNAVEVKRQDNEAKGRR